MREVRICIKFQLCSFEPQVDFYPKYFLFRHPRNQMAANSTATAVIAVTAAYAVAATAATTAAVAAATADTTDIIAATAANDGADTAANAASTAAFTLLNKVPCD